MIATELASTAGDLQAVIDVATTAAEPHDLDGDGRFFSVAVPKGADHIVVDLENHRDNHRDRPRRKTGLYRLEDAASLLAYVGRTAG